MKTQTHFGLTIVGLTCTVQPCKYETITNFNVSKIIALYLYGMRGLVMIKRNHSKNNWISHLNISYQVGFGDPIRFNSSLRDANFQGFLGSLDKRLLGP
jgi:hypothetical protein